jgi:S1-C subfamily serine protease
MHTQKLKNSRLQEFVMRRFTALVISFFALAVILQAQTIMPGTAVLESVVTIQVANGQDSKPVSSGVVVGSDGLIMTAFSPIRGAKEVQVRLKNGETYDKAEIVATDERRNVAILRVAAANLRVMPWASSTDPQVGSRVVMVANPAGRDAAIAEGTIRSVQIADYLPGAGKGYRLYSIDQQPGADLIGGLLLDDGGRSLGIVTTTQDVKSVNIAVPISSVLGLVRSVSPRPVTTTMAGIPVVMPVNMPRPIPQDSVAMPERGVIRPDPKGPGSTIVKPSTVPEILAASKTIYVSSRTKTFRPEHMINALNKRKEMAEWGLTVTNDYQLADLILELDHVLFTWKYTFKIYSQRLGTVIATGDNIIWDGNVGADDMANRVIEKLKAARSNQFPTPNVEKQKPADVKKDTGKS